VIAFNIARTAAVAASTHRPLGHPADSDHQHPCPDRDLQPTICGAPADPLALDIGLEVAEGHCDRTTNPTKT
jgi:hypothetical protein